jgi:Tfp pilus assembly protein PilE
VNVKHYLILAVVAIIAYFAYQKFAGGSAAAGAAQQGVKNNLMLPRGPWNNNNVAAQFPAQWPVLMVDNGNKQGPYRVG